MMRLRARRKACWRAQRQRGSGGGESASVFISYNMVPLPRYDELFARPTPWF